MTIYPKPDRSDYTVNTHKTDQDEVLDIGWAEGVLSDTRPFRAEAWADGGITMVTFFFSTQGLENASQAQIMALLETDGLVTPTASTVHVAALKLADAAGQDMWSVNIVVGDEDHLYLKDRLNLRPYPQQDRTPDSGPQA